MRFGDLGRVVLFCLCFSISSLAQPVGTVRDFDGKPIAGAKLMLYSHRSEWGLDNQVIEKTESAADGSYHFTKKPQFDVLTGTKANNYYIVTASHPDWAIGWINIIAFERRLSYDIVLTPAVKQTFIVKNSDGQAVEGATVWIESAGDADNPQPSLRDPLQLPTNIRLAYATTDRDGRATVDHLPRTNLSFNASRAGFSDQWKRVDKPGAADLEIKLTPAGVVRGTVRNEDGEAVADAVVWFSATWMSELHYAMTDADGAFECNTLVAAGGSWAAHGGTGEYKVSIQHPDYCSAVTPLTVQPGQTIDNFDISAEKGSLLRVIVQDPQTHEAVPGVGLQLVMGDVRRTGYTDNKGKAQWRVRPRDGYILLYSTPGGTYLTGEESSKRFTVSGDETEVTYVLPSSLKSLVDVRGKIVMPDDAPAKDVVVRVVSSQEKIHYGTAYGYGEKTSTDDSGAFYIKGFPGATRMCVYAQTRDRKLAGTGEFDVSNIGDYFKDPIHLAPTVSADVDLQQITGKPQKQLKMLVYPVVGGQTLWRCSWEVQTDDQSHLKFDGAVPGMLYLIEDARLQGPQPVPNERTMMHQKVQLLPSR